MKAKLERTENLRKQLESGLRTAGIRREEQLAYSLNRQRLKLEALSPLSVLNRGYTMVYTRDRRVLSTALEAEKQREMSLRFTDGEVAVIREEACRDE